MRSTSSHREPRWHVRDVLIPLENGQAVDRGWSAGRPVGVTWHWTATRDLATCRRLLGGAEATRRGVASAHFGVGRSFAEGIDRYVALANRSWHAGKNQTLRADGGPFRGPDDKGARTTVGVETVAMGFARRNVPAGDDWIRVDSPDGRFKMRVEPWTEEQMAMMIAVGREIIDRFPAIGPRDHHGHLDLCPGYKLDPAGFPFARLLRGIYDDPTIPDVWTPFHTLDGRRRALRELGYDAGDADDAAALRTFQRDHDLVDNGVWTTFVGWKVHDLLRERSLAA